MLRGLRHVYRNYFRTWKLARRNIPGLLAVLRLLAANRGPLLIVLRYGGIGDTLSLLPSAIRLREQTPGSVLVLACPGHIVPIVNATGAADLALPLDSAGNFIIQRFGRPLRVVNAKLPDEQDPPQARSRIRLSSEFQKALNIPGDLPPVRITPTERQREWARTLLQKVAPDSKVILFHSGPTWAVKSWSDESWEKLAVLLKEKFQAVIIQIGSEEHTSINQEIMPRIPMTLDWVNHLDSAGLTAVLSECSLLVGIDSGPVHMAAALGTPVVGIFGPTLADCILPDFPWVKGITSSVPCRGCHYASPQPLHWKTGCPNNIVCMQTLSPGEVFTAANELLTTRSRETESCGLPS